MSICLSARYSRCAERPQLPYCANASRRRTGDVVVFLVSMCTLAIRGIINARLAIAMGGGGLVVAGIGWADE